jgi:threonine dehydrogenase-like Zn-dependent dehydrogenase
MAAGRLPIEDLITHTARPEQCQDIYTLLADDPKDVLGVVFDWT